MIKKKKILIVIGDYYSVITNSLLDSAKKTLIKPFKLRVITVPGVFEIPVIISKNIKKFDAFIALGCVIKGETDHYHYISQAVTNGIMALTLDLNKKDTKIIFGVLTCQNKGLALARSSTDMQKNKGYEVGLAAIEQITTSRSK